MFFTFCFSVTNTNLSFPNDHFRKAKWGMSKKEVKSTEKETLETDVPNYLVYSGTVSGLPCIIQYNFCKNIFTSSAYSFEVDQFDMNNYDSLYYKLSLILESKYGKPTTNGEIWNSMTYMLKPKYYALAIKLGEYEIFEKWIFPETTITLKLTGESGKIKLYIIYRSVKLRQFELDTLKEEEKEGL
jgi:hypothetical protein